MGLDTYINAANQQFEEIEDEELWQDGEIKEEQLAWELFRRVVEIGDWKLIRRIDG